jgi:hypothetical protein
MRMATISIPAISQRNSSGLVLLMGYATAVPMHKTKMNINTETELVFIGGSPEL